MLVLQIAAACVFAGRAWQHLFWEAPYRELIWDQALMQGLIESLTHLTWEEFATSIAVDEAIQRATLALGIFYAVCALTVIFIRKLPAFFKWIVWAGAFLLVFLALIYTKDHFFHVGQFFEYALQFGTPVFFLFALKKGAITERLVIWMKVAIVLTFTCHGLYAIGYYPQPAGFLEMTMRCLAFSQEDAVTFLNIAGAMDYVVAVGIFLPRKRARWFLFYAACWGLATSLARVVGNFYLDFPWLSLHQWLFETVYRLPHFFIPFLLFLKTFERLERKA